jgi:glycosyltransferase involved in cell wall biosynthesis
MDEVKRSNKVLFIYQNESLPSSRIRVINLLPEMRKEGINPYAVMYPKTMVNKIKMVRSLRQFDAIFLQKKLLTPLEVRLFRRYAKRFVFDFDDAIYYHDDKHVPLESRTRKLKFQSLVRNVDLVVAGNRVLASYAGQFNKNVTIVPSAVETRNIPLKCHDRSNSDKIIIGWVGGSGNLHHLEMLSPVFQGLSRIHRIQIYVISDATIKIPDVEVKHIPWSIQTQEQEIALFDIGVMPLPNNKWTEGKCGYKALQYMSASVPPVCSDVGSNRDIVEHGREGFIVSSTDEFYNALDTLICNKDLRKEMGLNARRKVEKYFSISAVGKRLADEISFRLLDRGALKI